MRVYPSLENADKATLIDERLFIPKNWVEDRAQCKATGIPKKAIKFKTKPELALEMIDQKNNDGIEFDWIVEMACTVTTRS